MSSTPIHPTSLHDFKGSLHGALIDPSDERYDSARRIWNGSIDKHPAFIVFCVDVSDIISSIEFAHRHDLPVAVRGGGHGFAGYAVCDDGMVIDLSKMKNIHVNLEQRTARVEPGCTNGDLLSATLPYGLATATGIVSDVGIAGLALSAGEGWLSGKYGLTIDNMLEVEMITAAGKRITANSSENADLFWGVRGGTGNFGIVTAFLFQLHPVGQVLRGSVIHPMARARDVLHFYHEYTQQCPDELTIYIDLVTGPQGRPVIMLDACYCGDDLNEGLRLLAPLRAFGSPLVDTIHPMSLLESAKLLNDFFPPGRFIYPEAETFTALSDEVIDTIVAHAMTRPTPLTSIGIRHMHGAITRVEPTATPFPLRSEHYVMQVLAQWTSHEEERQCIDWVNSFHAALTPFVEDLVTISGLGVVSKERLQASYGSNYERLRQVKRIYDPTNFFHMNQNIEPAK